MNIIERWLAEIDHRHYAVEYGVACSNAHCARPAAFQQGSRGRNGKWRSRYLCRPCADKFKARTDALTRHFEEIFAR